MAVASRSQGHAVLAPLKGKQRARGKSEFKYKCMRTGRVAWYRLTDLVRATLTYNTISQMYTGLEEVVKQFGKDNVLEFNDRYQKPMSGGYRDLQLTVKVDGHVCELQLSTADMVRAKETSGHRSFEVLRELEAHV